MDSDANKSGSVTWETQRAKQQLVAIRLLPIVDAWDFNGIPNLCHADGREHHIYYSWWVLYVTRVIRIHTEHLGVARDA